MLPYLTKLQRKRPTYHPASMEGAIQRRKNLKLSDAIPSKRRLGRDPTKYQGHLK